MQSKRQFGAGESRSCLQRRIIVRPLLVLLAASMLAGVVILLPGRAPSAAAASATSICTTLKVRAGTGEWTEADNLLLAACWHLGQPYRSGGNGAGGHGTLNIPGQNIDKPIDCVNFVSTVFAQTGHLGSGKTIPQYYGSVPPMKNKLKALGTTNHDYITTFANQPTDVVPWTTVSLEPGDIIFYKWPPAVPPATPGPSAAYDASHVAIYMGTNSQGSPRLIHATGVPTGVAETGVKVVGDDGKPLLVVGWYHTHLTTAPVGRIPGPLPGTGLPCSPATAGAGFDFLGNGCPDFLSATEADPARGVAARLWVHPINSQGAGKVLMEMSADAGWDDVALFIEAGNLDSDSKSTADVLAVDRYGVLWLYPGLGPQGKWSRPTLGPPIQLASGLGRPLSIVAPGNFDGDANGTNDVIVERSLGQTMLYRGVKNAQAGYSLASGSQIAVLSSSTAPMTAAGDWDSDGHPDVFVRRGESLLVLRGTGTSLDDAHPIDTGSVDWSVYSHIIQPGIAAPKASRLNANRTREFLVAGRNGVPQNAVAATVNVTVVNQTSQGFFAVGPNASDTSNWSTLNFAKGARPTSASTTVALSPSGTIGVVFRTSATSATADVVLDVTGYYVSASADGTAAPEGSYFVPLASPVRFVDSRYAPDPEKGPLVAVPTLKVGIPTSFQVTRTDSLSNSPVPVGAVAVAGTLTVVGQTNRGWVSLTPSPSLAPFSTINFDVGSARSNDTVVQLSPDGRLTLQHGAGGENVPAATTNVIFDVTGYFVKAAADGTPPAGGGAYYPLSSPLRLIDSRWASLPADQQPELKTVNKLVSGSPQSFDVSRSSSYPSSPVPSGAVAVTATLTETGNTKQGYLALGRSFTGMPSWSTVNFPAASTIANGVHAGLAADGRLSVVLETASGGTSEVIFDLTGYYRAPETGNLGATYFPVAPFRLADTRVDKVGSVMALDAEGHLWGIAGGFGKPYRIGWGREFNRNGPAQPSASLVPVGIDDTYSSKARPLPGVTNEQTISVAFDLSGAGAGEVASVEAWVSYSVDGLTWSWWEPVGSGSSSPLNIKLDAGDGLYQVLTIAHDEGGGQETKDLPDTSIRLESDGYSSRIRSFASVVTDDPDLEIQYDCIGFGDLTQVQLYQRHMPAAGTAFGPWSATPVKTATQPTGTFELTVPADGAYEFYTLASGSLGTETKSLPDGTVIADGGVILDTAPPVSSLGMLPRGTQAKEILIPFSTYEPSNAAGTSSVTLYYRTRLDAASAWPASWIEYDVEQGPEGAFRFALQGKGEYQFYARAEDGLHQSEAAAANEPKASTTYGPWTYFKVGSTGDPVRLVDSRPATKLGLSQALTAKVPQSFQVAGVQGIPNEAVAVAGTLTVVNQTVHGYVALGPGSTNSPTWSTINFPIGAAYSSGVTTALGPGGKLSVVYMASSGSAHVVFDVTGYFLANADGDTFYNLAGNPVRLVDSRSGIGVSSKLSVSAPRSFQVGGMAGVPADATAVTGTLTVTGQTASGSLAIGPRSNSAPGWSSLNFPAAGNFSSSVTVPLGSSGELYVVYKAASGTANVIFDVTGYFKAGPGGATYFGLTAPLRVVDSRSGLGVPSELHVRTPAAFAVSGPAGFAADAQAVTGSIVATGQTGAGYLSLGPASNADPGWSTLNFPTGDSYSGGFVASLTSDGSVYVVYAATSGTTDVIVDVTGYYGVWHD